MPLNRPIRSRASVVRPLLDPNVPFPGGHGDRATIELPCMRIVEEDTGTMWYDICLSLRGGGDIAVLELPTRFDDFQTVSAALFRDFRTTTQESILWGLMSTEERFGVQTLLDVLVYFADNHEIAEEAWQEFTGQLEMAAIVALLGQQSSSDATPSDELPQEPEHANLLIFGIGLWASGRWPDMFPRPQWDQEDGREDGREDAVEDAAEGGAAIGHAGDP